MDGAERTLNPFLILIFFGALIPVAVADSDFFKIEDIRYVGKPPRDGTGVWTLPDRVKKTPAVFVPCLEVRLSTEKPTNTQGLAIRVHFYDEENKLVESISSPTRARLEASSTKLFDKPVYLEGGKPSSVFFGIPKKLTNKKWSAVAVFGDAKEIDCKRYPEGSLWDLDFPEKEFFRTAAPKGVERAEGVDPLIEHVVKTRNPKHPQITLFVRFPNKARDGSSVKGVVALCVLASRVEEVRRGLQLENLPGYGGIFRFADDHRFAILCWGSQKVWRPEASYDELDRETNIELDRSFDLLASAWERGILELNEKYNLPTRGFLLRGASGSAQWAHRLVLRRPDYFLAASIHIPSSFDRPTPDAAKVLWLLTSGELDGGYEHGIRWFHDCQAAGYPIIYKPIVSLGHADSPIANDLGIKFFEYALTLIEQRAELDKTWRESSKKPDFLLPWVSGFKSPEYIGDYLNQEVFPVAQQDLVPPKFRVPLPNKALADAWAK